MATSGSKSVTVTSWNTLKFTWTRSGYSVANNTSTVKWTLQLVAGSSGRIDSSAAKDWSVTVNGTKYSGTNTIGVAANATKTLASGTTTITHNADGTKSFDYSFSQEFGITFSGSSIGTKTGSGTGTLDTIPRATTPSLSSTSVNMGSAVTISTPRASSSFTHDLAYSLNGAAYVSIATGVGTSYSWTVPDLASKIPNAANGAVTIRCITKNGSTTVGTKTVAMTIKVPTSVVPTISAVAVTEATSGLAAQFGAFIQSKSKLKVAITAAGAKGSTIKSYRTTLLGGTYTAASFTTGAVASAGTLSMVTTVTDSRGRTAKKTTTITVLAYTNPKIQGLEAYRYDAAGNPDPEGEYAGILYRYNAPDLNGGNTVAMTIEYRRTGTATYSQLLTGTAISANTEAKPTDVTFSPDYAYDIRLTVTDYFGASSVLERIALLPSAEVILDIGADGKSLGIFTTAQEPGLTVGAETFLRGPVRGNAYGLGVLPGLTDKDDLNTLLTPGTYSVATNALATALANYPIDYAGKVVVEYGTGTDAIEETYGYFIQTVTAFRLIYPSAKRYGTYNKSTGVMNWSGWTYSGPREQKVLWSGGRYMTEGHTSELSEPISQQPNGVVLVFSRYENGAAADWGFNTFFISKQEVALNPGAGRIFIMGASNFATFAMKYLYINDDSIAGHANNGLTGTATTGITYGNNAYVLRYVIGV